MKSNYNNYKFKNKNNRRNNYNNNYKNNNKNNYKNNYNKNDKLNAKIPELYYLSYFLQDSKKDSNKNKIKKYLTPLLTAITEDKNYNNLTAKKHFYIIIKNKYQRLPIEFKEEYIKLENLNIFEEEKILNEKIEKSYKDAMIFLRDFRNIMMHKNVKEETFSRCKFDNFDGELFSFLRICLECEYNYILEGKKSFEDKNSSLDFSFNKNDIEKSYIDKVLQTSLTEMKKDFKTVPFIYALIILSIFAERKYIKEILELIKVKKFIKDIVLSFSLGGKSKTVISGIAEDEEELFIKQLEMSDKINKEMHSTGKRIIKELDYFNTAKDMQKEKINRLHKTDIYKKIIKFYGYINSFPKADELKTSIKEFKAKDIAKNNIEKMESVKEYNKKAREYNGKIDRGATKLAIKNENKNFETDYKKIIPNLKDVFRNEDIFMKEAMEFLSLKYNGEFGNNAWTISGNAVIWSENNDSVNFDVRKKVKPSKNGMNSIYKIVYNKENSDRFSLNRHNLRALITSILINGDLNLKELKETAANNLKPKTQNTQDANNFAEELKNKIPNWSRHNQASLIFKTVRKSIIKDLHLHNRDSVAFYKEFIRILYKLNKTQSIYNEAIEIIHKYGISDENISEEIRELLRHNNLKDMALASADILINFNKNFNKLNKKEKTSSQNAYAFKTWTKFAFSPVNEKNENIYKLLGWKEIKNNLNLSENNGKIDLFEILFNYFNKNDMMLPTIANIYKDFIKDNQIDYYAEKELRNIISEEMILYFIYERYLKNIESDNENYFYFESLKENNKKLEFDLVWNLNPKIKINIKDYMKRDVKSALDWIFDINRIKNEGRINGGEDLQKCLDNCFTNYNIVINHNILKNKCPKPTSIINIKNNILTADNIKDIVKVLIWAQKELLYFICAIETNLIYKLSTSLTENQLKNISNEYGYFDFNDLIENYNKYSNDKLDNKLTVVRNELSYGILTDYKTIIETVDFSLQKLGLMSLYENYNRKTKS